MHKIKVLLVSPYSAKKVGGIGTWTKIVLDYCKNHDNVELLFINTANPLKSNIQRNSLFRLLIGTEDTIVILVRLLWLLLFKRPDVVHYTSSASWALYKDELACLITRKIFRKGFVIHWRFGRIPEMAEMCTPEYVRLLKVVKQSSVSIVLDCNSLTVLKKAGCNNVLCVPNPLSDIIMRFSQSINSEELKKSRQVGEILFVGHIVRTKGVYELVRSCAKITSVKKLIIVGPSMAPVDDDLLTLASVRDEGKWLEFTGELQREDVYKYYQECSVFCLPSYTEGFPNVVLEAMACGCPIIATDVGAIPEMLVVDSDEPCGLCVHPQDEDGLIEALEYMLAKTDKAKAFGERARKRVIKEYSIDAVFSQYIHIWNNYVTLKKKENNDYW